MPKLGLREKIQYIHNPLPAVTDAEVLERAGLEGVVPGNRLPLLRTWQYSTNEEREVLHFAPLSFTPLRAGHEISAVMRSQRELGLVVVDNPDDEDEVRQRALEGLAIAQRFYRDNGLGKVRRMMREANRGASETDEYKYDYWPYHYNEALSKFIAERINELRSSPSKKKAPAAKE